MQIFETKVNDDDNRISNKLPLVKNFVEHMKCQV